ncbi:MAG: hypothetical protein GY801_38565 [bacterium]|nr:hypothetical protein [bacterium]
MSDLLPIYDKEEDKRMPWQRKKTWEYTKKYLLATDDADRAELHGSDDIVPVETEAEKWPFFHT